VDVSPIVCYDLYTGAELWTRDFTGSKSRSLPLGYRDGKIYAVNYQENTSGDTLHALDPLDGSTIWTAEDTVRFGIAHALTYAENGDLILPALSYIVRINHVDGSTVWKTPRTIPNTGAESLARYGDRLYGFEGAINTPKKLVAYDAATGNKLYETPGLPGDGDQEVPLMVGPDGKIYVIRDGTGVILAFVDYGAQILLQWSAPTGTASNGVGTWAQFGAGVYGSVYFVDTDNQSLKRLDPDAGGLLHTSIPLASDIHPRITVGTNGTLYVSTGTASDGKLYALTPDLKVIWKESFPYNYYSGPALGEDGYLAMAGNGIRLKVYYTENALKADTHEISSATGGAANFMLSGGTANAGRNYILLGSLTGIDPGTPLPGGAVVLPLNWDVLTGSVISLANTPVFSNFMGTLDASGHSVARFDTLGPLPIPPWSYGLYFAFALNNPWDFVSNPVTIQIVP
jgi:hypothetical protein